MIAIRCSQCRVVRQIEGQVLNMRKCGRNLLQPLIQARGLTPKHPGQRLRQGRKPVHLRDSGDDDAPSAQVFGKQADETGLAVRKLLACYSPGDIIDPECRNDSI